MHLRIRKSKNQNKRIFLRGRWWISYKHLVLILNCMWIIFGWEVSGKQLISLLYYFYSTNIFTPIIMLCAWQFKSKGKVEMMDGVNVLMHKWVLYEIIFPDITADPHVGNYYFSQCYFKVVHTGEKRCMMFNPRYNLFLITVLMKNTTLWLSQVLCPYDTCSFNVTRSNNRTSLVLNNWA